MIGLLVSAVLSIIGAGLLLTAWVAFRTADDQPDGVAWPLVALGVGCGGLGLWLVWTAAFVLAGCCDWLDCPV